MKFWSPLSKVTYYLLSTLFTAAFLFTAGANAATVATVQYSDPDATFSLYANFDSQPGRDTISLRTGSERNLLTVFSGTITQLNVPKGLLGEASGQLPSRTTIHQSAAGRTEFTFASNDRFGVISRSANPVVLIFPKPSGPLLDFAFTYGTRYGNDTYSLGSFKTPGSEATWLLRHRDGKFVHVAHTFNPNVYAQYENGTLFTTGKRIDLAHFDEPGAVKNMVGSTLNSRALSPPPPVTAPSSIPSPPLHPPTFATTRESAAQETRSQDPSEAFWNSTVQVEDAKGETTNATKIIKEFARDLRAEANQSKYQKADEKTLDRIRQIFRSLVKKEIGSAKILGPAGTGKTTLIKQLVAELAQGNGPEALQDTIFLQIDPAALSTGTQFSGTMATKINAMLALSRAHKVVWVIDEAHILRGAGTHSGNSNDILQMLKPGLTDGYFRMIGMSTDFEWNTAFAGDPALNQRFGEIKITEPAGSELSTILARWTKKHEFPDIDASVLDLIINLSSEFNAEGAQPRKGIALIEEIFAEQTLDGKLHGPTSQEVKDAAQRLYNLHPDHFDRAKMRARLANMKTVLGQSVVGQDPAKESLIDAATLAIAGVEDKKRPKGRKILAGPRGQGKTEMVMAFGKAMELPVAHIMMTKYTNPTQTDELKREIAQALRQNALSVLFFDEIEKAHSSVQKDLLDLLNNGRFSIAERSNGGGNPITLEMNARNAYVFMATNAGAGYIDSLKDKSEYDAVKMRESMQRDGLNELVLDRMDGVVPFHYLNRNEYRGVIVAQIRSVLKGFKDSNGNVALKLENLRGFIDQTVKDTYREKMSNREALSALSETLRIKLARAVLASTDENNVRVQLDGQRTPGRGRPGALTCPMLFSR